MVLRLITLFFLLTLIGCLSKEKRLRPEANAITTETNEKAIVEKTDAIRKVEEKSVSQSDQLNDANNETGGVYKISLEDDMIFGTNDEIVVGDIRDVAVDDQNRVFIKDNGLVTIHVFDPDGTYLTSLGREGMGPGEFSSRSTLTPIYIDTNLLFILDGSFDVAYKAHVFHLSDLFFQYTIQLFGENQNNFEELKGYVPKKIYPLEGDTLLVAYYERVNQQNNNNYIYYILQNHEGKIISDPIFKQKDVRHLTYYVKNVEYPYYAIHAFPFFAKPLFAISAEGNYYSSDGKSFEIKIYDKTGKKRGSFQHLFNNIPLDIDSLLEHYEETNYMLSYGEGVAVKMIEEAEDLPTTWPALKSMFFDDENRLWVSTIINDQEVYEWWLLENTGELIGKFIWPRSKFIQEVKNGYLYTLERETEKSEYFTHRYKMKLEKL